MFIPGKRYYAARIDLAREKGEEGALKKWQR